jgi:hypothetical protein
MIWCVALFVCVTHIGFDAMTWGLHVGTKFRHTHLKVRLSERERVSFEAAAELAGLNLSAWVRMVLRERIPAAFDRGAAVAVIAP